METTLTFKNNLDLNKSTPQILTNENFNRLNRMFATMDDYAYYMKSLWLLRSLISESINGDVNHKSFPIFETTNELIGCFLINGFYFDRKGDIQKSQIL